MKTSNTILITLIGSISLIIVAGAMQLRFTGIEKTKLAEQLFLSSDLTEFKYLVIRESVNLTVAHSDETKLMVWNAPGEEKPAVRYHFTGDTLIIDQIKFGSHARTLAVTINTPSQNIEWIDVENSEFSLKDFAVKSLAIKLSGSRLNLYAEKTLKAGKLKITGIGDSYIDAYNVQLDTLELHLDKSQARISVPIGKLKGAMVNNASLFIQDVADIEFRKDSSSRLLY